jgi:pyruvate dehydrogenase E2 component (dihydrolipoamide acetyltransferase)
MSEFRMPSLGADMDAGTLLDWYVKPGDMVKRGDIVALVDTDKAAVEIEIFLDGVVGELLIPPGEKVPVGTPLAVIQPAGTPVTKPEAVPEVAAPIPAFTEPAPLPPHATPAARKHALELGVDLKTLKGTGKHGVITRADVEGAVEAKEAEKPIAKEPVPPARLRASPLARRLAKELGVDLTAVIGTGPDGSITQEDVERAAGGVPAAEAVTPAPPVKKPVTKELEDRYAAMRRAIAAAMSKSLREIPHYYVSTHVAMSKSLAWLEEENLKRSVTERLLPAVLLFKATALAVKEVPEMNGFWLANGFKPSENVHLGIGISLRQGGLIAPAIHDADSKDLDTLMSELRDLVKRARNLQLRSSEMTDATLTVTNLGDQGVEAVYGIIYPPQVALVGFGKILEQPWAQNRMVGVRPVVHLTLAADHRASDGHRGGLYLAAIDRYLQTPEAL